MLRCDDCKLLIFANSPDSQDELLRVCNIRSSEQRNYNTNDDFAVQDPLRDVRDETNKHRDSNEPFSWNNSDKDFKCKIIRAILAISNLQDGGYVIIGVEQDKENN